MIFWDRAIEYAVYLGLFVAIIFGLGALVGNADVLLREVVENLLTTAAWMVHR